MYGIPIYSNRRYEVFYLFGKDFRVAKAQIVMYLFSIHHLHLFEHFTKLKKIEQFYNILPNRYRMLFIVPQYQTHTQAKKDASWPNIYIFAIIG